MPRIRSRRPLAVVALFAVILPGAVGAQRGRALTVEDYYRMKTVGAPNISPDGRWVAFDVGTRIEATNGNESEVWLVPTDASTAARRVSAAGANATGASWRDDGRLRFSAGGFVMSLDPASPDRIDSTTADAAGRGGRGGAGGRGGGRGGRGGGGEVAQPSPDGRFTANVRSVPFQKRPVDALSDFEKRHEDKFKGVQFDWLRFHPDGGPFPLPNPTDPEVNPPQEVFVTPGGGGAERQLTRLGLRPNGMQWSKDGATILFTADTLYRNELSYGRPEIWTVTVADGQLRRLTPNTDYDYAGARYSPDGRWILATRGMADDAILAKKINHGGATDLILLPAAGGREINLTADWDYLPGAPFWSDDSRHVYFTGGIGGTTHLFRVPSAGGPVEQITKGERRLAGFSYDRTHSKMAYTVGLMETPSEIYVANIDGSNEKQLTRISDEFTREVELSKTERLQFKSVDGTPVEGWLVFPHGYRADRGPYPLIVASHGGPHSADGYGFSFKNQYLAANGYFVLFVNFRSSTGYGEKFLWGTWGAWGTKDGQDVMAGVDLVQAKYPIDKKRTGAMGHSYGGFMTNWLITQYPDRFAAAIPGAGIANWSSDYGNSDIPITKEKEFWGGPWDPKALETMNKQSPLMFANRVKAATLFVIGELDQRVPYSETQQMYVAIKKTGTPAKVIQYAGMAHGITGHWNSVHRMLNERRWMDKYLKPNGKPSANHH